MAQTPNVIGLTVMQRLKETGEPATPENYERYYYEISGLPRPESALGEAQVGETPNNAFCTELLGVLRQMLQEVTDKTETLAKDLGEKNKDLAGNVTNLKSSRDKSEILRLLSTVVMQAGGIQNTVEASHKDLVETRRALVSMQEELAETRQLLNEDALTGALNRRGLDQTLMREIARAQRLDTKLSLAMVDLDFFKKVNDQYGHEAGDQMLVHFASLIKSVLRKSDALVRYGGEEFTLILPDTDSRGAHFVLARLQQLMSKSPLVFEGKQVNTTFSAGVATLRGEENGHALLRRADEALYSAKNGGRNAIKVAA
ncbi:MAG TPA: GGDEF domain-containing protein [Thiobacillaceae bacterium]|nr:GGDEF domain-containing protein [Thiobacillaceae bacterium]HNA81143.1 GGDEF domain-containing protein [Thiobacillaceae bacterium]HNF88714.1 GGDEF domain-containing protein [Thiobacillaceae bacterium]HNH88439.1 GGDEF domain-containing protein [Thiobacillaceae bacterium]HNI06670.1 GGDEF domain-containing protein [Thiobacillaceae bacterium]